MTSTIRLGLMPPLTGLVELYGPEISWAGQIAVAEINAAGGVLGRELELVIEDDGSMPDTAVAAANRLIDTHGCHALIGNLLSNSRLAVADRVAGHRGIPYLNFSFYEGSISNRYFFNFAALPNQQIARMIPYMAERFGPKMYFAGNNYEWPRGSIDAAKASLLALGGEVVGEDYLPLGLPPEPIEALLDDVAKSGADVLVPYFAGTDQIELLQRFAKRGLKRKMAVVMGHYDEAMVRFLEPRVRVGLYSSNTYFMEVPTAANRRYLQRLRQHPEVDELWPQGYGVLTNFGEGTYCCVHAYAQAVTQAGTPEPEAVIEALEQVEVESCQGRVRMDPDTHHAEVNSYLACCRLDGTFEIIERFGRIAPEIPDRYQARPTELSIPAERAPVLLRELPAPGSISSIGGLFRQILDLADVAVIATDAEGVILQANLGACRLFGYTPEEFVGISVHLLIPPHQRQYHAVALREFEQGETLEMPMGHRGEISGYRRDGTLFPAEASISKFNDAGHTILVATLRDITTKKRAEQELTWRATHDPLTRLPNRDLIRERLDHALLRSEHTGQSIALLFIDLDHFKLINDTYGHDAGDRLLIGVANVLLEQVRAGDTVGRLGGDEFVVLCEQVERIEAIEHLAERINDTLRKPMTFDGRELFCTASIGLALGRGGSSTAEEMLRNADVAMYVSKEQGRDETSLFTDVEKNLRVLRALADLGLRIAVDDFGTGYSSLLQLLRLPVSMIKIDREFVAGIDQQSDARLIVSAIIKMGKALNKGLVAEGVENTTQLFELQSLRCQAVQGFHLYRPMDEPALIDALLRDPAQEQVDGKVYYVIYVSRACQAMSERQLQDLLETLRRKNREIGVTGFLLYQSGYFMQMLEGKRDLVDPLMRRIAQDPRHENLSVIMYGYEKGRLFTDWSMGFWNMGRLPEMDIDFINWQKQVISLLDVSQDARFCYAFFEALSKTE